MVKEGPCFHCGIDSTPLWRNGPPEKPVLCNACGSRWRIRGTLDDYIPKHAMKEYQTESFNHSGSDSSPLTSENNSFYFENNSDDTENNSEHSEPNFKNIPKRRRSNLDQVVLSPMGRLHKQLYDIAHIPGVISKEPVNENVLIDHANIMMFTPPETLLGAKLLQSPPKNLQRTESMSSSNAKETLAFGIATNGSDRGGSSST